MKLEPAASSSDCAALHFSSLANGSSSQHHDQNAVTDRPNGLAHAPTRRTKRPLEAEPHFDALPGAAHEPHAQQTASQTDAPAAHASASTPRRQLGTRKRKKTRMFEIAAPTRVRRVSTGALGVPGRGDKLCDIPNVVYNIDKAHSKDAEIEFLHRLLFNFAGGAHSRKSNIRSFSGFIFSSDKERNRVRDKLMRAHLNMVRKIAKFLDVPVTKADTAGVHANGERASNELTTGNASDASRPAIVLSAEKRALLVEAMGMDDNEISETCADMNEANAAAQSPQKNARETAMTAGKEQLVRVVLEFLEHPRLIEGRESLAERDKELRRQKKAAEKARAQKAALKKAAEKKAALLKKKEVRESDEDGDEDLETGGTTWIELAKQWKEAKERKESGPKRNGFVTMNGHG